MKQEKQEKQAQVKVKKPPVKLSLKQVKITPAALIPT